MNVYALFQEAAEKEPDKLALVHNGNAISYRDLQVKVHKLANYFRERGLKTGDRALVFVPVGLDLYATVLALFHVGAVVLFIDDWASPERVKKCLNAAPCDTMICTPLSHLFSWKVKALRNIKTKIYVRYSGADSTSMAAVNNDDGALITFTTGSTGLPKAADRTHGFLQAQVAALKPYLMDEIHGKTLCTLPIVTLANLALGKTTVVPHFYLKMHQFQAEKMRSCIEAHHISELITSPYYVSALGHRAFPNSLQKVKTGGGAVFPNDAQHWLENPKKLKFTVFYGSTECEPVCHIDAEEIAMENVVQNGIPAGNISSGTEVVVVDFTESAYQNLTEAAFQAMQVDGVGEILVSGKHVLERYIGLKETELSNKVRVGDGLWHRTGDAGRKANDRLFLYGRCHERIAVHQGFIFPFQVEALLRQKTGDLIGTALKHQSNLYLILLSRFREESAEYITSAAGLLQQEFLLHFMDALPMDPRHNTKIDYAKIREDIGNI